jgi:nitrite reductase/ring-hydroxylating ferredoxin subunit
MEIVETNQPTRRAALVGLGAVLAGIGLVGPSQAALAAAKTYTVGKTTDIKVGSAKSYLVAGVSVLVTQPKKGVFKAFKGVCTHQGGNLSSVSGKNIVCPLHGASFDSTSGKPTGGPASTGLKGYKVTVSGTSLKVTI